MKFVRNAFLLTVLLSLPAALHAGSLEGRITAAAGIEVPPALSVAVDDWVCGQDGELPDPRLVIGPNRGLANVVVRVDGVADAPAYPADENVLSRITPATL